MRKPRDDEIAAMPNVNQRIGAELLHHFHGPGHICVGRVARLQVLGANADRNRATRFNTGVSRARRAAVVERDRTVPCRLSRHEIHRR